MIIILLQLPLLQVVAVVARIGLVWPQAPVVLLAPPGMLGGAA